ncbi:unnamed protein product [Allacma fusca]|uniref:Uncharacterized protein n=1 Tax=Allacma fusca TaxID=39272 RepID=A0A8J2JE23_9HEXA|nr:unnamed protein product [Allacma fusca]
MSSPGCEVITKPVTLVVIKNTACVVPSKWVNINQFQELVLRKLAELKVNQDRILVSMKNQNLSTTDFIDFPDPCRNEAQLTKLDSDLDGDEFRIPLQRQVSPETSVNRKEFLKKMAGYSERSRRKVKEKYDLMLVDLNNTSDLSHHNESDKDCNYINKAIFEDTLYPSTVIDLTENNTYGVSATRSYLVIVLLVTHLSRLTRRTLRLSGKN